MKKVLIFNKFYLPGYKAGGPIKSIKNIVSQVGDKIDFTIITGDRDSGDTSAYQGVQIDEKVVIGKAKVIYTNLSVLSYKKVLKFIRHSNPDVVYLNSIFDTKFSLKVIILNKMGRLKGISLLIAPRGEFSDGALSQGRLKKKLYLWGLRKLGFFKNVRWHASSIHELNNIKESLPEVNDSDIEVAINLPDSVCNTFHPKIKKKDGELKVVFLSRIAPKKNLDYALRALKLVKSKVSMTIFGPKEVPSYWQSCEEIIQELPSNVRVFWGGELTPDSVFPRLSEHHLFFFPTKGENYGHVIQEALTAGLIVLTSDQTPWDELESKGVGWTLPLLKNHYSFAERIDAVAAMNQFQLQKVSQMAHIYALEKVNDKNSIQAYLNMFNNCTKGKSA